MHIEIRNLSKRFGAVTAVDCLDLAVPKPQMIGVIGGSGAGKSTLLRLINRLAEPSGGAVLFEGRDVLALQGRAKRSWQRDCAMIFQQFNLVPRLDVMTNVLIGRLNTRPVLPSLFKLFPEEERAAAAHNLERLGMIDAALQRAETLSGGQQQRVAIARALMQQPRIILADEPIASLDPKNAQLVMRALRQIHEVDGLTVITNLHSLDTARAYCDRIIGLRQGALVFDGGPADLSLSAMADIYGRDGWHDAIDGDLDDFAQASGGEFPGTALFPSVEPESRSTAA